MKYLLIAIVAGLWVWLFTIHDKLDTISDQLEDIIDKLGEENDEHS